MNHLFFTHTGNSREWNGMLRQTASFESEKITPMQVPTPEHSPNVSFFLPPNRQNPGGRQNGLQQVIKPFIWLSLLTISLLAGGCKKEGGASAEAENDTTVVSTTFGRYEGAIRGRATIVADEALREMVENQLKSFQAMYKGTDIQVMYLPGESAVETLLNADSIFLGVLARQLSEEEVRFLKGKSRTARMLAQATEGVAVVVHRSNPDSLFTEKELTQMLNGEITNWKQLNPANPLGEVTLVIDKARGGVSQYLRDSVMRGNAVRGRVFSVDSTAGVLEYVARTPGALGIISLTPISDLDDPEVKKIRRTVRIAALEKRADASGCVAAGDFFQPYQSYLATGCYPWRRNIFTVLTETQFGLATGFVSYIDSDQGQRIIHKSGLVPAHTIPRLVQFPPKSTGTDIVK